MGKRAIGFIGWIANFIAANWVQFVAIVSPAIAMILATKWSEWLNAYGPIAWVSAGILGIIAGSLVFAFYHWGRSWIALRRAYSAMADRSSGTNPLKGIFRREVVDLRDFFSPAPKAYKNVTFEDCRIVGPGVVVFEGNVVLEDNHLQNCNYIVLKDNSEITGVVIFSSPKFIRTEFHFVTLLLNETNGPIVRDALKINLIGYESKKP